MSTTQESIYAVPLKLDVAGAGAGAREGLRRWKEQLATTPHRTLDVSFIDPAPQKALMRAKEAAELGFHATVRETSIQQALREDGASPVLVLLAMDDARAIAEAFALAVEHRRAVVLNVFVVLPSGKLAAVRGAFSADDADGKRAAAAFFATLDTVTERAGSDAVFGAKAPPANILLRPPMRKWFAEALDRALSMAAGLRPKGTAMELTFDGVTTLPLLVRDSRSGWATREALTAEILANPPFPMRGGTSFVIAEIGNGELQLVTGHRRITDKEVVVDAVEAVDAAGYAAAAERAEEARQRAADASARREAERKAAVEESLRRAERSRITRLNPVYVTD